MLFPEDAHQNYSRLMFHGINRLSRTYQKCMMNGYFLDLWRKPKVARRAPSKSLILKWIKQSWDAISPDIIRKSFKKCGISNALDGSEDNLFQNEGDDDPFEGFDEEDVRMDEEILANVSSFNEQNTEISDGENEINSELEEENESDYDSDGHQRCVAFTSCIKSL